MQKLAHEIYSFDEFRLDLTRGALFRGDDELKLRPKSFDVLKYLTENQGRLVSKDEIIEAVWQETAVTDDSLVQCLKDIRRALGDDRQTIIKTVPRRGYIFESEVSENGSAVYVEETSGVHFVFEESEETNGHGDASSATPKFDTERRSLTGTVRRHKLVTALALGSFLLIAGGVAYGMFVLLRRPAGPPFKSVNIKRLTTDGRADLAAISPDGNYVVYQINESGGKESLWLRQVAAVNPKQIVEAADVAYTALTFSRDGNFVYYVQGNVLYQVPTLGGASRKIWEGVNSAITFSSDGTRVAFVRQEGRQQSTLLLANADGTGEPTVLAVRTSPEFFTWGATNGCAWSPDGANIVCVGGDNGGFGQMYPIVTRVSDGKQWPATSKRWNYAMQVAWLSDGSGLMLCGGDGFDSRTQLWHVSYPGGETARIYNDFNVYEGVSLTASSGSMVSVQEEVQSNIFAVNPFEEPQKVREITKGPERKDGTFTFTPDGRIVLETQHGGSRDLWIMDSDGGNQKQLTFDSLMETMPRVSPDGRSIIFVSNPGIWKIDIDGSNRRQLSKTGLFPEFSPDGEWIIYTATGVKWTMWKMRSDGSDPQQLTDLVAVLAAISPDGKMIAFVGKPRSPAPNITIIPFDGGEPIKVLPNAAVSKLEWSRDGKAITYITKNQGIDQIVSRPIDGGDPVVLFRASSEDQNLRPHHWSPDGRMLYFASGPVNRNVVMFSLER